MKRALAGVLALSLVTLLAGDATAQEAPAAPPPARSTVRLDLRPYKDRAGARVYAKQSDDSWVMVCALPCTVDSVAGAELRITMGRDEEEPHSYIVPGDLGPQVDVEVKPASIGPLVGGIVMMGTGGALSLMGLLVLAVADTPSVRRDGGVETVGYVLVGLGVGAAAGGLVWLLSRSHEPRVSDRPKRRPMASPLGLGFTF